MVLKEPKLLKSFIKYLLLAITQEIRWLFSHSNNSVWLKNNFLKIVQGACSCLRCLIYKVHSGGFYRCFVPASSPKFSSARNFFIVSSNPSSVNNFFKFFHPNLRNKVLSTRQLAYNTNFSSPCQHLFSLFSAFFRSFYNLWWMPVLTTSYRLHFAEKTAIFI